MILKFFLIFPIFLNYLELSFQVDIKTQILHECNFLPSAGRPNELEQYFEDEIIVDVNFIFMKLYALDEVQEYLTYSGAFSYTMTMDCIKDRVLYYNKTKRIDDMWALTDSQNYWQPAIVHANSKNDFGLQKDVSLQIMVLPFQGIINYGYSGLFTSSCELNFFKFPFDNQHCDWVVETWFLARYLKVRSVTTTFYNGEKAFISKNVGWKLNEVSNAWKERYFLGAEFHEFRTSFNISRQPNFFIVNVMLPCGLLTAVQGATLLLPPETTDRAK